MNEQKKYAVIMAYEDIGSSIKINWTNATNPIVKSVRIISYDLKTYAEARKRCNYFNSEGSTKLRKKKGLKPAVSYVVEQKYN